MALSGISGGGERSGGAEWRSQLTATPASSSRVGLAQGGSTKSAVEREKTAGVRERKKRACHRGPKKMNKLLFIIYFLCRRPETGRARQVGRKTS